MTLATNLGFPRIGRNRELKKALEYYWAGAIAQEDLHDTAANLRADHWTLQQASGIAHIPSNDFSLYDHVLDTALMVNAVPERFRRTKRNDTDLLFAMARGKDQVAPLEMTKWFDTNYHYLVPEIGDETLFHLRSKKPVQEFKEALALGIKTRPVLLSPASFLRLSAGPEGKGSAMNRIGDLLPVYAQLLRDLVSAGADWIQMDEPILTLDLTQMEQFAIRKTYAVLCATVPEAKIALTTYFGRLGDNRDMTLNLPVHALHVDMVNTTHAEYIELLERVPDGLILSLGLVDGRNVWRTNLRRACTSVRRAVNLLGSGRVWIGPSCSLLHAPVDLELETKLPEAIKRRMAFATQKLREICILSEATNDPKRFEQAILESDALAAERQRSADTDRYRSQAILFDGNPTDRRSTPFPERRALQAAHMPLPPLPTTMIGSLPQTRDIRAARKAFKDGTIAFDTYVKSMRETIASTIRWQEDAGLDVLVHGEPERNDMVEYFADMLNGFVFTQYGWVQSYGSRCVKPPVIAGDVSRTHPMTVYWLAYAQSLTEKPVKGMLTGPVTMLKWSFVRDDIPLQEVCFQIALALRDEVEDLERAGVGMIQIDEPALREGLPLRRAEHAAYLEWAVQAFRLCSSGVKETTQIHTHMCYADVEDILPAVRDMDADVISLEASRSAMDLLRSFRAETYPNDVGPGVWDIHSPNVPTVEEMASVIRTILGRFSTDRVWVNPDCGLKTRGWKEVIPSIRNMIAAARQIRATL